MILGTRTKDPADIRIYAINWAPWLGSYTLSTSVWSTPTGITYVTDTLTTTATQVKLSGGTSGHTYVIANTVTTSNGETKRVTFEISVETN